MNVPIKILFIKPYVKLNPLAVDAPLGILCLSAYLKQHLGSRVDTAFLDLRLKDDKTGALIEQLETFRPDIIGISLLMFEEAWLAETLKVLTTCAPAAKLIVGGPQATANYEELLATYPQIHCIVIGEGEQALLNLVKAVIEGQDIRQVRGIAYHNGSTVVCNEREAYINNLDSLPLPDYRLIDLQQYWANPQTMNVFLVERQYAHVMSSRACPYQCIYCHNMFGKRVRTRSPKHFVNEIIWLYDRYGVREFHIIDDIFNFDRSRMREILRHLIASEIKIKLAFPNGLRGDLLEEEDILLLKNAGAYMLTFAIETGSERMQTILKKHIDSRKVMANITYANKIGLLTQGYFMLGFPEETVKEMKQTVALALRSKLDMASFFLVVPYQGTELFQQAEAVYPQCGKKLHQYDFFANETFYKDVYRYNTKRLQQFAYSTFYLSRLPRLLWKFPKKWFLLNRMFMSALDLFHLR